MDINRAFTYFKEDEEWVNKFLIGSILILIPFGAIPVMGWLIAIIRNRLEDENAKLPDWNDIGAYTVDGLKTMLIGLVWGLPIIIPVLCFQATVWFGLVFGGGAFASGEINEDTFLLFGQVIPLLALCIFPFILIYSLIMGVLIYPAYGIYAEDNSISKALDPRNAFKILRSNLGDFIVILAVLYGASFLAPIGLLLCVVGIFPLCIYIYTLLGDLIAQAYKKARINLALADEATK